jgi:hypothetical protein
MPPAGLPALPSTPSFANAAASRARETQHAYRDGAYSIIYTHLCGSPERDIRQDHAEEADRRYDVREALSPS